VDYFTHLAGVESCLTAGFPHLLNLRGHFAGAGYELEEE
jgi:hypothetical protein